MMISRCPPQAVPLAATIRTAAAIRVMICGLLACLALPPAATAQHREPDSVLALWPDGAVPGSQTLDGWLEEVVAAGEGQLRLVLLTEHGTYVKEAISGEDGRTEPSLTGMAGAQLACLELDVHGIIGEDGGEAAEPATFETPFGSGL